MYKFMTRKGLAIGATAALAVAGLTSTPAYAAGEITLNPSAGTSFNTLTTSTFSVSPVITGVDGSAYKYLRYLVTNDDEKEVRVDIAQGGSADGELTFAAGTTSNASMPSVASKTFTTSGSNDTANNVTLDTSTRTAASLTFAGGDRVFIGGGLTSGGSDTAASVPEGSYVVASLTGDKVSFTVNADTAVTDGADTTATISNRSLVNDDAFVVAPDDVASGSNANALGSANTLTLDPQDDSTAQTYTVRAWIDGNQNNVIDPGETASATQTIEFKAVSSLSGSVSISGLTIGSSAYRVSATLTGDINYQQVASGDVKVQLVEDTGTFGNPSTTAGTLVNLSWNSTLGLWDATKSHGSGTTAADDGVTAVLVADNDYDNSGTPQDIRTSGGDPDDEKDRATARAGSAITNPIVTASATATSAVVNTATLANDAGAKTQTPSDIVTSRNGTVKVKTGTASLAVNFFAGTDSSTTVGINDAEITLAVTSTNVTNTDAVSVNGVALSSGAASTTFETGTTGNASITVDLGAADDGDVITLTPTVGSVAIGETMTITVTDGTPALSAALAGARVIESGDTISMTYNVVDEFGAAPANGSYVVKVAPRANERATAATWAQTVPVTDGQAVLSVVDNGAGAGEFEIRAELFASSDLSTQIGSDVDTEFKVVADKAAATLTLEDLDYGTSQAEDANNDGDFSDTGDTDKRTKLIVSDAADFGDFNPDTNLPTESAPTVTDGNKVVVGATVANAADVALEGALVTFSGTGLQFKSGSVYATDAITVAANSSGVASVDVWSSVGGDQVVTITSGDASVTQTLQFAPGTTTADALAVATVGSVNPGTTTNVVATVTDAAGNAVEGASVRFTTTIGYMAQATVTTDANGVAVGKLVTAPNDNGASTVVVSIPADTDITAVTQTVNVGTVASADQKVNAGSFKGYVALYAKGYEGQRMSAIVAGKWLEVESLASDFERIVRFTGAGYDIKVRIYIDGTQVGPEFDILTK